jgi:hypothetical protein
MNSKEANTIYKDWQKYKEINDKLGQVFKVLPESFLPYPAPILKEALDIVSDEFAEQDYYETCKIIDKDIETINRYQADDIALKNMAIELILIEDSPELKKTCLKNLQKIHRRTVGLKNLS